VVLTTPEDVITAVLIAEPSLKYKLPVIVSPDLLTLVLTSLKKAYGSPFTSNLLSLLASLVIELLISVFNTVEVFLL
jgi:hypothetical protein